MSIRNQAAKGMIWSTIERFSTQGIQFVLTIIIARILLPDDYGLVAMLSIFMAISQSLVDSGFGNALIQKKKRTETDYSTAFCFNIVVSICIYSLLYITAPFIAAFYDQPQLVKIARVLGLNMVIVSLGTVQMIRFTIELDFKRLTIVALSSVIGGGAVGIWMAFHGFGVWALVFQTLIGSTLWSISLWLLSDKYTCWGFSIHSFRQLFSFGSRIMISGILHTVYVNMYSLVVGKFFNASILGYFNRAYTLGQFPVQNFSAILLRVLYPVLCRYQDNETKFNYIFANYLRMSCFIIFPVMILLSILAEPIIGLLLTDKWLPAAPLLQIICLAQMWDPIMKINTSALEAKGRSDFRLYSEIIKKIIALSIMFGTLFLGIRAVCIGLVFYAFVDVVITIWFSKKVIGRGYLWHLKLLAPIILLTFTTGILVLGMSALFVTALGKLLSGMILGALFYGGIAYLLKFPELLIISSFLKERNKSNNC